MIFTLFHCSTSEHKYFFIENLLLNTKINNFTNKENIHTIGRFDFIYKEKIISINYYVFNKKIDDNEKYNSIAELLRSKKEMEAEIIDIEEELAYQEYQIKQETTNSELKIKIRRSKKNIASKKKLLENQKDKIKEFNKENGYLSLFLLTEDVILQNNLNEDEYIFFYCCKLESKTDYSMSLEAFIYISNHVFMAAPLTQPYLFLSPHTRAELLENLPEYCIYLAELTQEEEDLPNFYFYNQLTIEEISEAFNKAIENDNQEAIANMNFTYGSSFKNMVEDFHNFLGNDKYILPNPKLNSVVVQKQISEIDRIELEAEDLSHGELRRLGLYAWIKYNIPEDSIILIDEVENALHPDWQYNIADELASWGNNQYLLATHSFHLCEALTPKHVKEIEPKMCKPSSEVIDQ